jgi:C-terminal processing protease CtpA/Prc
MGPGQIALLRPGVFLNLEPGEDAYDPKRFHAFIDKAMEDFLRAGAKRLLIDLRDNPGGDNAFSDHLVAWFANRPFRFCSAFHIRASQQAMAANAARLRANPNDEVSARLARAYQNARPGAVVDFDVPIVPPRASERFEGLVDVLINRRSFSNSVAMATLVQDYRFGRILGEATADPATSLDAIEQFTLPETGIAVSFPKALVVRPSGERRPLGVTPDVLIDTPAVEDTHDPVLQAALHQG